MTTKEKAQKLWLTRQKITLNIICGLIEKLSEVCLPQRWMSTNGAKLSLMNCGITISK